MNDFVRRSKHSVQKTLNQNSKRKKEKKFVNKLLGFFKLVLFHSIRSIILKSQL